MKYMCILSIIFWFFHPEAILYPTLDPKTLDIGIPNFKPKFLYKDLENNEVLHSILGFSNHHRKPWIPANQKTPLPQNC